MEKRQVKEEELDYPPGFEDVYRLYFENPGLEHNYKEKTNEQGDVEYGPPPGRESTSLANALPKLSSSCSGNRKIDKQGELTMAKGQKDVGKFTKKGGDYASKLTSDIESMVKDLKGLPLSKYRADLERTPFKLIFLAIIENKVLLDKTIKFEEDIIKILSIYNNIAKTFNFGGLQMSISREDVKSIFGVIDGSVHIKPHERTFNKTAFYNRCFQDREEKLKEEKNGKTREYKLTRQRILNKLVGIENVVELKHRSEDFARLATLFVLSACLAPTSSQTLMWKCTEHVDNLSAICSLDWSRYILETLITSISQGGNKAFGGCLMLLPYWLCEKFNIIKPMEPNAFPGFLKWNLQQLHVAMLEYMTTFENLFVLEREALLKLPQGSVTRELKSDARIENLKEKLRQSEEAKDELKSEVDKSRAKIKELEEKLKISEEGKNELEIDAEKSRAEIEELKENLKTSEETNDKSKRRRCELESQLRGIVEKLQESLKEGEDKDQPADQEELTSLPEINRKHVGDTYTRELRASMGVVGKRQNECQNGQPSKRR